MDEKREKSIFRLLPRNSNFTWFLVTFALKFRGNLADEPGGVVV